MGWTNMSTLFADDIIAGTDTISNVPPLILDEVASKVEAANKEEQSSSSDSTSGAEETEKVAEPTGTPHVDTTTDDTAETK